MSAQDKPQDDLMKLDFSMFVMSLVESAHIHLGDVPGPDGHMERDIVLAQHNIEFLELLEDKTKGNLTGAEESLLMRALDELRQRFTEASKES